MAAEPIVSGPDESSLALLKLHLEPDERLLWAGKPGLVRVFAARVGIFLPCQAALAIHCFLLTSRRYHRNWRLVLLAIILDVISNFGWLVLFFGLPFRPYNRDRNSLFGLTDRRAIRLWPLHSVSLINEKGQPVSIRRRILGRLTIGDTSFGTRSGIPRYLKAGTTAFLDFFAIAHRDEVMRIALEAQQRELRERSKLPAA